MKANEFVKKFGWEYAKHILTDDAPLVMDLKYTNLKRLVESHELVEECGGITKAKERVAQEERLPNPNIFHVLVVYNAIADVESCL